MKTEWDLVEKIFSQCADVKPSERQGLIDRLAAGNDWVHQEVSRLLACDATASRKWLKKDDDFLPGLPANNGIRPGQMIDGYTIGEKIGQGAFGTVFQATDSSGARVAIKFLKNWELNPRGIRRFRFETLVLSRIAHENVARLIAHGMTSDTPFLVIEYIDGQTLDETMRGTAVSSEPDSTPIDHDSLRQRLVWFRDVASGVAAVHDKMILHRDLKPSNIMIRNDGTAVVTDFGLAKCIDPLQTVQSLTLTGQIVGTPQFMSPEQLLGSTDLGATADIYSLGAILYYLITGRPPFVEDSFALLSERIRFVQPVNPRSMNANVDRGLAAICLNCLKKNPLDRYRNVTDVIDDVERWLDGRPVQARSISTREHVWHWAKRNRLSAALMGIIAIVTLGSLVLTTWFWQASEASFLRAESQKQDLLGTIAQMLDVVRDAENNHSDMRLRRQMLSTITDSFDRLAIPEKLESKLLKTSAVAYLKIGRLESMYGDVEKSENTIEEAKRRFQLLIQRHPDDLEYQFDYFHCLLSQRRYEQALDCILSILAQDDSNIDYQATVGHVYFKLAEKASREQDYDVALNYYSTAEDWTHQILEVCSPDKVDFHQKNLAEYWWGQSRTKGLLGDFDGALEDLQRADSEFQRLYQLQPEISLFSYYCVDCLLRQSAWDLVGDDVDRALSRLNEAEVIARDYLNLHNSHPAPYLLHFHVLFHQAICAFKLGDHSLLDQKQQEIEDHLALWKVAQLSEPTRRICEAYYWIDENLCPEPDLNRAKSLIQDLPKGKFLRSRIAFREADFEALDGKNVWPTGFAGTLFAYYPQAVKTLTQEPMRSDHQSDSMHPESVPDQRARLKAICYSGAYYRWSYVVDCFEAEWSLCQQALRAKAAKPISD